MKQEGRAEHFDESKLDIKILFLYRIFVCRGASEKKLATKGEGGRIF